jgi:hypothetical protein
VAWTYGLIALAYGRLNLFTFFVAAIIIGLGIDYLIHLSHRFWREHAVSADPARAMERTFSSTGGSILAGAATTRRVPLDLITSFVGLHEPAPPGIAAGAALPSPPSFSGVRGPSPHPPREPGGSPQQRRPRKYRRESCRRRRSLSLRFDASPESMNSSIPPPSRQAGGGEDIRPPKNPLMVVEAPDAMTLPRLAPRRPSETRRGRDAHSARSLSSFFPMPDDQRAALARSRIFAQRPAPDAARLRSWLAAAADKEGIAGGIARRVRGRSADSAKSPPSPPAEISSSGPISTSNSRRPQSGPLCVSTGRGGRRIGWRTSAGWSSVRGVSVTGIHLVLSAPSQVVREVTVRRLC